MTQPQLQLTFSPLAWLKLQYFLHAGDTEIGGFGVASPDNPLYIEDFKTVKQQTSCVTVKFDDTAVADYFEDMAVAGLKPISFGRIWIHTHPGTSPSPSSVDETTLERVFGKCDWSVMFIIARGGSTYARLTYNIGPKCELMLNVAVDWSKMAKAQFDSTLHKAWAEEFLTNVHPEPLTTLSLPPAISVGYGNHSYGDQYWNEHFAGQFKAPSKGKPALADKKDDYDHFEFGDPGDETYANDRDMLERIADLEARLSQMEQVLEQEFNGYSY